MARVETPWGDAFGRAAVRRARRAAVRLPAAPRPRPPHPAAELNFRANIDALKRAGVTDVVSLSAVGSLQRGAAAGPLRHRRPVHRPHLRPREELLRRRLRRARLDGRPGLPRGSATRSRRRRAALGLPVTRGGTYLVMEGPQFSTQAESELYRGWGCDVIGMTNMPEAKLAREAELCYATVAMVTDFDCWHPDHDHVTVDRW